MSYTLEESTCFQELVDQNALPPLFYKAFSTRTQEAIKTRFYELKKYKLLMLQKIFYRRLLIGTY
jgi:hypothetical protein